MLHWDLYDQCNLLVIWKFTGKIRQGENFYPQPKAAKLNNPSRKLKWVGQHVKQFLYHEIGHQVISFLYSGSKDHSMFPGSNLIGVK